MRVSKYFKLRRTQATLDFVDVDITGDTRVFISPKALASLPSEWGEECVFLVRNFFETILHSIKTRDDARAERLLRTLREPNETHLGLSKGAARGRGLGRESAHDIWRSLSNSGAVKSGLLEDLEDTVLMVEKVSVDIVSDITTNIIRGPLIAYTQRVCEYHEIPLTDGVDSGPLWNPHTKEWESGHTQLPIAQGGKLLLVPKAIVRRHMLYDMEEYYRHYLLVHLQSVEISANSELVHVLKKSKERRVYKKDLAEKYGRGKLPILKESLKYPEVLKRYKEEKGRQPFLPLTHEEMAKVEGIPKPDWDKLLAAVLEVKPGKEDAPIYERQVEALLTALFYPHLTNPMPQTRIHDGRKRIDITYTNMAKDGFFLWLSNNFPAAHVFVECKNYGKEIGNPELDQIAGRFSPSRGRFGLIVCRSLQSRKRFEDSCKDTADDQRGFIIALDDKDLEVLVDERKKEPNYSAYNMLHRRFRSLVKIN